MKTFLTMAVNLRPQDVNVASFAALVKVENYIQQLWSGGLRFGCDLLDHLL